MSIARELTRYISPVICNIIIDYSATNYQPRYNAVLRQLQMKWRMPCPGNVIPTAKIWTWNGQSSTCPYRSHSKWNKPCLGCAIGYPTQMDQLRELEQMRELRTGRRIRYDLLEAWSKSFWRHPGKQEFIRQINASPSLRINYNVLIIHRKHIYQFTYAPKEG